MELYLHMVLLPLILLSVRTQFDWRNTSLIPHQLEREYECEDISWTALVTHPCSYACPSDCQLCNFHSWVALTGLPKNCLCCRRCPKTHNELVPRIHDYLHNANFLASKE
jgi:hypothetical protein